MLARTLRSLSVRTSARAPRASALPSLRVSSGLSASTSPLSAHFRASPSCASWATSHASFSSKSGKAGDDTPLTETVRDFLPPDEFYHAMVDRGMDFFAGVPDSLLKDFCAYVTDHAPDEKHVITANEGSAVSMAAGYHMATKKFPVVYMQNSGFGNAVNPLLSLTDPRVYSIPMLLLIGWRGEPGKRDEPQHYVQGKVMSPMMADMDMRFEVLPDYIEGATEALDAAVHHMENRQAPYAFLVKRQCFEKYRLENVEPDQYEMRREDALRLVLDKTGPWDILVSTTGFTSREVYEIREDRGQDHRREFLTVGSMGHASAISMGISLAKPSRQVICLDGDGAALMHMGNIASVGVNQHTANYKHILINNGAHDSVGGQPTRGFDVDFLGVASACGYNDVFSVSTAEEITAGMERLRSTQGPVMMEIRCNKGARGDLGRPKEKPVTNKNEFMRFLEG